MGGCKTVRSEAIREEETVAIRHCFPFHLAKINQIFPNLKDRCQFVSEASEVRPKYLSTHFLIGEALSKNRLENEIIKAVCRRINRPHLHRHRQDRTCAGLKSGRRSDITLQYGSIFKRQAVTLTVVSIDKCAQDFFLLPQFLIWHRRKSVSNVLSLFETSPTSSSSSPHFCIRFSIARTMNRRPPLRQRNSPTVVLISSSFSSNNLPPSWGWRGWQMHYESKGLTSDICCCCSYYYQHQHRTLLLFS